MASGEAAVHRVAAFCGLANPQAFFETLQEAGAHVVTTAVFADHHRYTSDEVRKLSRSAAAAGATVLVTTEKDRVNLPADCDDVVKPLRICTVAVRTRLRNESEFLAKLDELLGWASPTNKGGARR